MNGANIENFASLFQLKLFLYREDGIFYPPCQKTLFCFAFHIPFCVEEVEKLCENNLNLFSQQEAYVMLCSLMRAPESSNEITVLPGAGDQIRDGKCTKCM